MFKNQLLKKKKKSVLICMVYMPPPWPIADSQGDFSEG